MNTIKECVSDSVDEDNVNDMDPAIEDDEGVCPPTPPSTPPTTSYITPGTTQPRENGSATTNKQTKPPPVKHPPAVGKLKRRSSIADFNAHIEEKEEQYFGLRDVTFDPHGNIYYYWMTVITMALVYNFATVILRMAFAETRDIKLFMILDYLSDALYLIDIAVHYRTAYLQDGILVRDPKLMAQHFQAKSDFRKDLIAIFPVGFTYSILKRFASWTFLHDLDFTRSDMLLLIVRLTRLLKYNDMVEFFSLMDSRTNNPNMARAFKLSLYLWIVIHWIACFYYMMSVYEGLGLNEWVYTNDTDSQYFTKKYIRCTYWSMMTLTTIGDHAGPETDLEHVFTGMTFLVGVFVFAAVVGNVGDVISSMNAARQDFIARMDQIKFYMNHRHVSIVLQNRVKRWADYSWARTQAIDESELLQMLPDRLRTEVAISVHLDTLKKVTIFEECEESLLHELVLKLRPQIYSPGDYICRIGEIGREMYIINHGKVEILVASAGSATHTVVATLAAGNYFGEISLLKLDGGMNRRTADVRSVGYAELLRLSRKDLTAALLEYPEAKEILENQARKRMQETQQVRRTTSKENLSNPASSTAAASVPIAEEKKPKFSFKNIVEKKKSKLADVIKSDMFQKLINNRGKEMTELKEIINELRDFDSMSTKKKITELSEKCIQLEEQLNKRNTELKNALQRVSELEVQPAVPNKPNGYKHCKNVGHGDHMCHGLNENGSENSGLLARRRNDFTRPKSRSFNGLIQHLFPNVPVANILNDDSSSTESLNAHAEYVHHGTPREHRRKSVDKTSGKGGKKHRHKARRWSTDGSPILSMSIPGISINDVLKQAPMNIHPAVSDHKATPPASPGKVTVKDANQNESMWGRLKKQSPSSSETDGLHSDLLTVLSDDSPFSDASSEVTHSSDSSQDSDIDTDDDSDIDVDVDDIYIDSVD